MGPVLSEKINSAAVCAHCGFALQFAPKKDRGPSFCCYGCSFAYQILLNAPGDGRQVSWVMVQLGAAAFLAMNVMGFSFATHASSVYGDFYARISDGGKAYDQLLRYILFMMSAPVLFLIGVPLFEKVISDARDGRWGVEGFISVSVLAAFAYSMVSTIRGIGPVYYDIATMVLVFLTLGRYLEARFRLKASTALEGLLSQKQPAACLINKDGGQTSVDAADLRPGDLIMLRAGNRVPADADVISGTAVIDMAPMTGESMPAVKKPGSVVWSGAYVTEGFLRARVIHAAHFSWMARLGRTLEYARSSKSRMEGLASKIVTWVTISTVVCAAAAFFLGAAVKGPSGGLMRALSVLVIVCPCALGAAIPLSLWKSFERVAGNGILFKNIDLLESLSKVRGVFFDKTGTLTASLPRLAGLENHSLMDEENLLSAAAGLAQASMHPFSRSIVAAAEDRKVKSYLPQEVYTETGQGLRGRVGSYGCVVLGNAGFLHRQGCQAAPVMAETDSSIGSVFLGIGGKTAARFEFEEAIRPGAKEAVDSLKACGLSLGILTGDCSASADRVGRALGLDVTSGLSPEDKLRWIREWEALHGPALVVGDGLNDGPVLAGACVSLAMGGALASAREAADFSLPDDDLSKIPWLLRQARQTHRKIRINLFWAFIYNGAAVPFAVAGLVNPIAASMIMIFSSAFIILHSLRAGP